MYCRRQPVDTYISTESVRLFWGRGKEPPLIIRVSLVRTARFDLPKHKLRHKNQKIKRHPTDWLGIADVHVYLHTLLICGSRSDHWFYTDGS